MDYEIIHQPEQHLFKTEVDGRTAFVQYRLLGAPPDRRSRNSRCIGESCVRLRNSQRNETESHLFLRSEVVGTPSGTEWQ